MNKLASDRRIEDREVVVYGAMVQLQHLKTGKYVSIDVNKLASHEKDALHCHVTTDENQNCWLGIFPRYSVRMVGDPVQMNDEIKLGCSKKPDHAYGRK